MTFKWKPASGSQTAVFLLYPAWQKESERALWGPFIKGTNVIHKNFPLMT